MKLQILLALTVWTILGFFNNSAFGEINASPSLGDEGQVIAHQGRALQSTSSGQFIGTNFWVYPTVNTTNVSWPAQRATALNVMMGESSPNQDFQPLQTGKLGKVSMITLLPNGGGQQLRAGLKLGRTTTFHASQIWYEVSSSDPGNVMYLKGTFSGLSVSRLGKNWTSGATFGTGDPLINEVTIAGVANGFVSNGSEADNDAIRKFVERNRPWSMKFRYGIGDSVLSSVTVEFNLERPRLDTFIGEGKKPMYYMRGSPLGKYDVRFTSNVNIPWEQWTKVQFPQKAFQPDFAFPFPFSGNGFIRVLMTEPTD
jgi:hypothetical protein